MSFMRPRGITVFIRVDSELATSTKTSASRQNLSIQLSSCVVTSVPGLQRGRQRSKDVRWYVYLTSICLCTFLAFYVLNTHKGRCKLSNLYFSRCLEFLDGFISLCYLSTSTRSSRSRAHLLFGQNTRTRQPASRLSSMWSAWASWFTVCTGDINRLILWL